MEPEELDDEVEPRRLRKWPFVLLGMFLLFAVVATAAGYYVWNGLRPVAASNEPVQVTIPKGAGTSQIANALQNKKLIRNATLFSLYLRYKEEGQRFQAGTYEFKPGANINQIIDKLNKGETIAEQVIKFTIPEGFTVKQIAQKLAKEGLVDQEKFLQLADETWVTTSNYWNPDEIGEQVQHRLEGYLFPETYEMKVDSTETDILNRMTKEWDNKLSQLPEDWEQVLEQKGITFHQLLTIASLIEKEAVLEEERPMVASVIYNRLEDGMLLQIDATIQYLFDEPREKVLYKDLEIESPYNTYLHKGFPPGPIASPGLSAIKAALYPDDTPYFFYVTKKDGTSSHYFSKTLAEHNKNIEKSKQNEKDRSG